MADLAYLAWLLTIQVAFVTMLNVMSSRFLLFATYGENVKSQIPSTNATLSRFAWVNHTMQLGETVHAFNARVFGINKITSNRARLLRARRWGMCKVRSRNACRGWSWDEQRDDHGLYVKNLTLVFHTSPLNSAYLRLSPLISYMGNLLVY